MLESDGVCVGVDEILQLLVGPSRLLDRVDVALSALRDNDFDGAVLVRDVDLLVLAFSSELDRVSDTEAVAESRLDVFDRVIKWELPVRESSADSDPAVLDTVTEVVTVEERDDVKDADLVWDTVSRV